MRINKEPWLAASLSWVFPGAGHLYLGAYVAGAIVIAFVMLLHVVVIASLLSTRISSAGIVLLMVCDVVVLPICVTADAFRDTRSRNTSDFEAERTSGRDPWLAVFLGTIVPGIGQFYLRKWIAGAFLLAGTAGYFALQSICRRSALIEIGGIIPWLLALTHIYVIRLHRTAERRRGSIRLVLLLSAFYVLSRVLMPQIEDVFVAIAPARGPSMFPTMPLRSRVVYNRLIYRFQDPVIGDIVGVEVPQDSFFASRGVVKRIVAVGGEAVQVRDGIVYVDGVRRDPLPAPNHMPRGGPGRIADFAFGVTEPCLVPEGCYFLLGDNRWNSGDSREFGPIPRKSIVGKAVRMIYPFNALDLYRKKAERDSRAANP